MCNITFRNNVLGLDSNDVVFLYRPLLMYTIMLSNIYCFHFFHGVPLLIEHNCYIYNIASICLNMDNKTCHFGQVMFIQ